MVGLTEDYTERRGDVVVMPAARAWKSWRLEIPNRDERDVREAMGPRRSAIHRPTCRPTSMRCCARWRSPA